MSSDSEKPSASAPKSRNDPAQRERAARSRAPSKLQRWIDLLAALLARNYAVSAGELMRDVPAYAAARSTDAALMRMFERDKDELRGIGVPIETVKGEDGEMSAYRLSRRDFYLPYLIAIAPSGRQTAARRVDRYGYRALTTLSFEPDELAAIAQAAARVESLGDPLLREQTHSAMRKLAVDLPVDPARLDGDTVVLTSDPAFDAALFQTLDAALQRHKRVEFTYRAMTTDQVEQRTVEPYGLFFVSGHWYLAGRDADRNALRNFRIARITALSANGRAPQTPDFAIPVDFRLRDHARSRQPWELGQTEPVNVLVRITRDTGAAMAAATRGAPVAGAPDQRVFAVRRVGAFLRWVLSFGGELVPMSPPSVVDAYRDEIARSLAVYNRVAGADGD